MVDPTSGLNVFTQDIVAAEDHIRMEKLDSAAALSHSSIMSLIKLRQNGATKVSKLPSGVFRCILEYQLPKFFCWRYSDPTTPIQNYQDKHFPAIDKLDYKN